MKHIIGAGLLGACLFAAAPALAQNEEVDGFVDAMITTVCAETSCGFVAVEADGDERTLSFTPAIPLPDDDVEVRVDSVVVTHSRHPMPFSERMPAHLRVEARGVHIEIEELERMPAEMRDSPMVQAALRLRDTTFGPDAYVAAELDYQDSGFLTLRVEVGLEAGDEIAIAVRVRVIRDMPPPPSLIWLQQLMFGQSAEQSEIIIEFLRLGSVFITMPVDSITYRATEYELLDSLMGLAFLFISEEDLEDVLRTGIEEFENFDVEGLTLTVGDEVIEIDPNTADVVRDMEVRAMRALLDWRARGSRWSLTIRPTDNVNFINIAEDVFLIATGPEPRPEGPSPELDALIDRIEPMGPSDRLSPEFIEQVLKNRELIRFIAYITVTPTAWALDELNITLE